MKIDRRVRRMAANKRRREQTAKDVAVGLIKAVDGRGLVVTSILSDYCYGRDIHTGYCGPASYVYLWEEPSRTAPYDMWDEPRITIMFADGSYMCRVARDDQSGQVELHNKAVVNYVIALLVMES
jgi:hypothetical protein